MGEKKTNEKRALGRTIPVQTQKNCRPIRPSFNASYGHVFPVLSRLQFSNNAIGPLDCYIQLTMRFKKNKHVIGPNLNVQSQEAAVGLKTDISPNVFAGYYCN